MASVLMTAHHMGASESAFNIVKNTKPRAVKLVNSFGVAPNYKQAVPGIIIIGRVFNPNEPNFGDPGMNPTAAANAVFDGLVLPQLRANPDVDYWEDTNEPVIKTPETMERYCEFALTFMARCEAEGKRAVFGNFPAGTPELPDGDRYAVIGRLWPALKQATLRGHILGVHEYICPGRKGETAAQPAPGHVDFLRPQAETWLQFRYRWFLDYADKSGLDRTRLKVFISEAGIDNLSIVLNGVNGPEQINTQPWREYFGNSDEGAAGYTELMAYYEMGLRKDQQSIVGSAIFTSGGAGWDNHNIDDSLFTDKWIAWSQANPLSANPTPPVPPVPPVPVPPGNLPAPVLRGMYIVTADVLNVRAQPMTNGKEYAPKVVKQLRKGEAVRVFASCEVYGNVAAWALISQNGNEWVRADYLKPWNR